jgi:8-amino-7-oxononanoate synthase
MQGVPYHLSKELKKRLKANNLRHLKNIDGVDFSSNDYLGFSQSKVLKNKIDKAYKNTSRQSGSTGSRLLTGNSVFAEEIEIGLANFFKNEAAILFNSGYNANTGLISCIAQREDTIIYDQLCHASIRDGIKLSNASNFGFKHNDLEDLKKKLAAANGNKFVIVESIYSMDGDFAPLKEIEQICKEEKAFLIVDEAHSTGIYGENGEGICVQEGVNAFARIHTFGKAMGCHGACVIGSAVLKEYLINFSKTFIYTTSLPLHALVCINEGIKYLPEAKEERALLFKNIEFYNSKIGGAEASPIRTTLFPGNKEIKAVANRLQKEGYAVFPILHPTVPEGEERIRICLHAFNTEEEIIGLANSIKTKQ